MPRSKLVKKINTWIQEEEILYIDVDLPVVALWDTFCLQMNQLIIYILLIH